MKVVLVRIVRGKVGEDQMVYPKRYNAEEVGRNGLGPCSVNGTGAYSGHIGRGGKEEWCIVALDDALAEEYAEDVDMDIIDASTADTLMEEWRIANEESEDVISDPERIHAITAKQTARIKLSASDMRALDPDDPEPGVTKRLRSMHDILARVPQSGLGPGASIPARPR